MYSAALQRYYNEHEHLPYTFYAQPKRFTQYAIEKRGELLATAYNYIEPDAKGTRDFVEYSSADFTVTDFHSADRVCVVMRLPEPTMPLHCKMIGCSVKFDGSCPVWRTVELTEQGSFLLCGWNADHILDFFAEPDILKTADSTPLENLVMFRIVDPLKVILVALDERIEISGVHGSVSLFYIW